MKNSFRSGFSLLEIVIALGIASILSLAAVSILNGLFDAQRSAKDHVEKSMLITAWLNKAKTPASCTASIQTATLNPPTVSAPGITEIAFNLQDDSTSPSIIQQNQILQKYGLKISPNGFHVVIPSNTVREASGSDFLWHGYVELAAEKLNTSAGGKQLKPSVIGPLTVRVDAANTVIGCYGDNSVDPGQLCSLLGGTWTGLACTSGSKSACASGQIQIGPNPPADCISCAANSMLVSTGSGFSCQPYLACPAGTSKTGAGGVAVPSTCKCNAVGEAYDPVVGCSIPSSPICVGGASTTPSLAPASPAGCYCGAGFVWNGSSCSPPSSCMAYNWGSSTVGSMGSFVSAGGMCSSFPDLASCDASRTSFMTAYNVGMTTGFSTACYAIPCMATGTCAASVIQPPTCTGGASKFPTANPAPPAGCYCPSGKTWNVGLGICQ